MESCYEVLMVLWKKEDNGPKIQSENQNPVKHRLLGLQHIKPAEQWGLAEERPQFS